MLRVRHHLALGRGERFAFRIHEPNQFKGGLGVGRGDVVAIRDAAGAEVARGLANYSSAEARLLCRKPSAEIPTLLGYMAEPEMVHRDNMVLSR